MIGSSGAITAPFLGSALPSTSPLAQRDGQQAPCCCCCCLPALHCQMHGVAQPIVSLGLPAYTTLTTNRHTHVCSTAL